MMDFNILKDRHGLCCHIICLLSNAESLAMFGDGLDKKKKNIYDFWVNS